MTTIFGESRMQQVEKDMLIDIIPSGGLYIEIGSLCGASVSYVLDRRPDIDAICIDNLHPGHGNGGITAEHYLNLYRNYDLRRERMNIFIGTAREFQAVCDSYLQIDVVLVDGDHSEAGCYADLEVADELLAGNQEGLILVHDFASAQASFEPVKKATNRFCEVANWRLRRCEGLTGILERMP